jgi:hypothetical protein
VWPRSKTQQTTSDAWIFIVTACAFNQIRKPQAWYHWELGDTY